MKSDNLLRHMAVPLVIALLIYAVFYSWISYRRTHNGPWEVTFTTAASVPTMLINQPKLGITNVRITFPGETNFPATDNTTISLSQPKAVPYDVPFGKCVFMDPTFLPGTVVFDAFGHEIQLLPRILTIDKKEIPWQSNTNIWVMGSNTMRSLEVSH